MLVEPGMFWLVVFIIMVVVELATMGLATIWFAGGAAVAFILSLAGCSFIVQIVAFFVVSVILLAVTRPLAMKHLNLKREKTNTDDMIGKSAIVLTAIDNDQGKGQIRFNGIEWTARSAEGTVIPEGAQVEIVEIKGVKAIVKLKNIEKES